jgi:hypothetical protein
LLPDHQAAGAYSICFRPKHSNASFVLFLLSQ